MSDQNKNRTAMAAVDEDALAKAIDADFGDGAMSQAREQIGRGQQAQAVRTPLAQKVAERIADYDESPAGQMKIMVDQSRAKLAELDDKRVKLESYRDVQIEDEEARSTARRAVALDTIATLEKRIAMIQADIRQGEEDRQAKVIKINADVDIQVDAIDQMEAWHRNVVEGAAKNVTPRKGKAKKEEEIPY